MTISINVDQTVAMVIASGSPSAAVDQTVALLIEQRLQPQIIYTQVDQTLALVIHKRGLSVVLTASAATALGNGAAQVTITATVLNSNGAPVSGTSLSLGQGFGSSTISTLSAVSNAQGQVFWTVTDINPEIVTYAITNLVSNSVSIQFTASRADGTVYGQRGPVVAGANLYFVNQPANTSSIPPSILLNVFSDPLAQNPITQPLLTDGYGRYSFYYGSTLFTLVVVNNGAVQVYTDMEIGKPTVAFHSINAWVKSTLGPAIPGSQLFLLDNNFPNVPPTLYQGTPAPQQQAYSDSNGLIPMSQPNISDGNGFDTCYVVAGCYTLALYLQGTLMAVYQDVSVGGVYAGVNARYHGWVKNVLGVAQPNNRVLVSLQPTQTPGALVPEFPTNLASICSDANGYASVQQSLSYDANGNPVINSLVTDGNGYFTFTIAPNTPFTISVYNQSNKLVQVLPDQVL